MVVQIVTQPAQRVAAVPHRGPYQQIGEAFMRLDRIARESGLDALPGVALVGIFHDSPESVPADQLRAEAGLIVPASTALPSSLTEVTIPAGRFARTEHRGPYERLGETWTRLREWLTSSGHRMRDGVSYEEYKNTPAQAAPADLRTDLYLPVE